MSRRDLPPLEKGSDRLAAGSFEEGRSHTIVRVHDMPDPFGDATDLREDRLLAWTIDAEPGSAEQVVLASLTGHADGDVELVLRAVRRVHAWNAVRARVDRERHRRSTDLGLQLPFSPSRVLLQLVDVYLPRCDPRVHEMLANAADEMLECFPDEDAWVTRVLTRVRAVHRLLAGREEAHFELQRVIAQQPEAWDPIGAYVEAMEALLVGAPPSSSLALLRRIVSVLERALRSLDVNRVDPRNDWCPIDSLARARAGSSRRSGTRRPARSPDRACEERY